MQLVVGSYSHPANQVDLAISKATKFNERNEAYARVETWTISGFFIAKGSTDALKQTDIKTRSDALVNHYNSAAIASARARFLLDDGTTEGHVLSGADSVSGLRVITPPSFPGGKGAEFATKRFYSLALQAEFVLTPGTQVVQFSESVSFKGGGAHIVGINLLDGPPAFQQTHNQTFTTVTQSGQVVGQSTWLAPQPPLDPDNEVPSARVVQYDSPKYENGQFVKFRTAWSYTFLNANRNQYPPNFDYNLI